jgi:hypothetical protein
MSHRRVRCLSVRRSFGTPNRKFIIDELPRLFSPSLLLQSCLLKFSLVTRSQSLDLGFEFAVTSGSETKSGTAAAHDPPHRDQTFNVFVDRIHVACRRKFNTSGDAKDVFVRSPETKQQYVESFAVHCARHSHRKETVVDSSSIFKFSASVILRETQVPLP